MCIRDRDNTIILNKYISHEEVNMYINNDFNNDGILGHWKFNSGSGEILYDHSGNQNHGTINGATWVIPATPGENNSLSFDGVDDYVDLGDIDYVATGINGEYSISLWLKINDLSFSLNQEVLWIFGDEQSGNGGVGLFIHNTYGLSSTGGGTWESMAFGYDPPENEWVHLALQQASNDTRELYVNGTLYSTLDIQNRSDVTNNFLISKFGLGGNRYANGQFDHFQIWDHILTESQIQFYMSSTPTGEGIVGFYTFNEGEGDILYDYSGNQNHGTIYGATWSGDSPTPPVYGCTDSYADNYDTNAFFDDGSCSGYPENGDYVLSFDGIDDWVDISNSSTLNVNGNELTIIAKVKVEGSPSMSGGNCSHTAIISKTNSQFPYGGYGIISNQSQSKWIYALGSQNSNSWNEVYANSSFLMNEFQLLAGTFNGNEGTAKFFVDNSFETENGFFTGPVRSVNDLSLIHI